MQTEIKTDQPRPRGTPVVATVDRDTIIELVYDPDAGKTGLVVSRFGGLWNIEQEVAIHTGEMLVPYSAKNNLIANRCILLPSKPEHHGDKAELLAEIEAFLKRYVELSPAFLKAAVHYILLTWVHDAFSELPYLRLRGDYGTGKTRGLLAIGSLCYRPFFASGASTVSPIFHTLDRFGGTLILDEADFRFSDPTNELVKILNNGNAKGMPVLRTVQNRDKEFNPRAFKVFGPKIIAMRGGFDDPALESRFLTEEMGQRVVGAHIPVSTPPEFADEALALRNKLLHYRLCHLFDTKPALLADLAGAEARTNQIALPLLSLIEDSQTRREVRRLMRRSEQERRAERSETVEAKVVAILARALTANPEVPIGIAGLAEEFTAVHGEAYGAMPTKRMGQILRRRLRLSTYKSNGVSVVPLWEKPSIDALYARYTEAAYGVPHDVSEPDVPPGERNFATPEP